MTGTETPPKATAYRERGGIPRTYLGWHLTCFGRSREQSEGNYHFGLALFRRMSAANKRKPMPEEFACPNCGSPSVVYPNVEEDDGRVECRACGTFLATRGQFRRFVETRAARSGGHTSGC